MMVASAYAGNSIMINQSGDNFQLSIQQTNDGNSIHGTITPRAEMQGDSNTYTIQQGTIVSPYSGNNDLVFSIIGDYNTVGIGQGVSLGDSGNHSMGVTGLGSNNSVIASQTKSNSNVGHQLGINLGGNGNTVYVNQKGSGTNAGVIDLEGDGHYITLIQEGSGNQSANIGAHNAGGASNIMLNQGGANNNSYQVDQFCVNPAGCSVTVTQY